MLAVADADRTDSHGTDSDGDDWADLLQTGRVSAFRLPREWFAACFSLELGRRRPLARTVHGLPLVMFRDGRGAAVAAFDRCPHRNAPLSLGRCRAGELECAYHGWRFDSAGACVAVPGWDTEAPASVSRRLEVVPAVERDGIVWVVPSLEPPARSAPPAIPHVHDDRYTVVRHGGVLDGTMVAAIENALDVPHTAVLHRGLFRGRRERLPIEVVVRHGSGQVEAHYVGEPVPPGLAARLLAPDGGVVEHVDRFVAPCVAQVEYRLGDNHLMITTAFTPVATARTALHATVAVRARVPGPILAVAVGPIARRILDQDARMVARQHDTIRAFGGERFANTPIDVLGPHILRLLRRAERDESLDTSAEADERVTLYA
jgi:phenylpropionate dioxygenase-like ring-hydroxylating dioxygenase large terminal subunit